MNDGISPTPNPELPSSPSGSLEAQRATVSDAASQAHPLPRELMESCLYAAQEATFDGFGTSVIKEVFRDDPKRRRIFEIVYRMGFESGWRICEKETAARTPARQEAEPDGQQAKNAARYEWLRAQHQGLTSPFEKDADGLPMAQEPTACAFTVFMPDPTGCESLVPVGCLPGELDEVIDAALRASSAPTTKQGD